MNRLHNMCQFIGNVGRDPEMRYTASGTAVLNLSIAVDRPVKRGDTWEKGVQWVRLTFWGLLAERANQYVGKGYKLAVQSHYQSNQYTDNNGQTKYSNEFVVDEFSIVAYPKDSDGDIEQDGDYDEQPSDGETFDDIPF